MKKPSTEFLLILFGDINFDGRAKRMVEIAQELGNISIIDASTKSDDISPLGQAHFRIKLNENWHLIRKHLTFWYHLSKFCLLKSKPSVILAENFFVALPGLILAKIKGSKLVYDAYELTIVDNNNNSLRDKFWYNFEKFAIQHADIVIAANPERAEFMLSHYKLNKKPIHMRNIPPIPNINKKMQFEILETYPILKRQNPTDKFILYQGDISLKRGIDRFIKCIPLLPENYKIILAGDGPDLKKIKSTYKEYILAERLIILGRIRNDLLPAVTLQSEIGIVTYPYHGINNIYCAPNKLFEYAQAGVPVIATNQKPISNVVNEFENGILIDEKMNIEEVASSIIHVVENRSKFTRNMTSLIKTYHWDNEFDRVLLEIKDIIKQ